MSGIIFDSPYVEVMGLFIINTDYIKEKIGFKNYIADTNTNPRKQLERVVVIGDDGRIIAGVPAPASIRIDGDVYSSHGISPIPEGLKATVRWNDENCEVGAPVYETREQEINEYFERLEREKYG